MRIKLTSLFVDDQQKALKFYTDVLGFVKKNEIPDIRWLTVVSPEDPDGVELLLEPNVNPAAKTYQKAIFEQGVAATAFAVSNVRKEYERMKALGVQFTIEPMESGGTTIAVFDDTCGNLIQIFEI